MTETFVFGYGSLVNRATHNYETAHPATLHGWRRSWRHTALRPVAYLTAEPCPGISIEGLIAGVPALDWPALDEREEAYDRHPVTDIAHPAPATSQIRIYAIPHGKHAAPTHDHPILLSYLDVVVQGYLAQFGQDGARDFFDTTAGWDAPIMNDRANPVYPRAQNLTRDETAFVDEMLKSLGVKPG